MIAYQMLRVALQTLSAVFGGIGVFALYVSFYQPVAGLTAILMLGTATAMVRLTEQRK